jgi:type VI protein secretion system component Hcp
LRWRNAAVGNQSVTITREWGDATQELFASVRAGEALGVVSMHFRRGRRAGPGEVYRVVRLIDARLAGIRQYRGALPWCPPGEMHELEELTFDFAAMETVDTDRWLANETQRSSNAAVQPIEAEDRHARDLVSLGSESAEQQAPMVAFFDLRNQGTAVRRDSRRIDELFNLQALLTPGTEEDLFAYAVLGPRCVHIPGRATLSISAREGQFGLDPQGERISFSPLFTEWTYSNIALSVTVAEDGIYVMHFDFSDMHRFRDSQIRVFLPDNVEQSIQPPPTPAPFAFAVAVVLKAGQALRVELAWLYLSCRKIRVERATA